jgi:hypothetical protein
MFSAAYQTKTSVRGGTEYCHLQFTTANEFPCAVRVIGLGKLFRDHESYRTRITATGFLNFLRRLAMGQIVRAPDRTDRLYANSPAERSARPGNVPQISYFKGRSGDPVGSTAHKAARTIVQISAAQGEPSGLATFFPWHIGKDSRTDRARISGRRPPDAGI